MITLGSKVKDIQSGFSGIATARTEYQYGCARICIEPTKLNEGKPIEVQWFDEQRVEVIKEQKPAVSKSNSATSGGPQNDPKSRVTPSRDWPRR
jgi:cellulase/cellobiase CelA1